MIIIAEENNTRVSAEIWRLAIMARTAADGY
jgi:hypothetical protein